jgi:DNA helicase-2/ATP-dependent DNA helicase PcrA
MSNITGTPEQEAIWNAIQNTNDDIVVGAGAGTGKTFTIIEASGKLPTYLKRGFLCFNKSIQLELQERLPEGVEAKTFHALGFGAFFKQGIKPRVNKFKVKNIIDSMPVFGRDFQSANQLVKLVSLIKGSMTDCTDEDAVLKIIDYYNIKFASALEERLSIENVCSVIDECIENTNQIDFDDMIWLPLVLDWAWPQFDVLFVDEAQDFNEMQRELIVRCTTNGRCIIVGDKNQAIYGFRGADSNSIAIFSERLEKMGKTVKYFPMTLTWRCPKSVVKEANRYVKEFNCLDTAEEGAVHVDSHFNPQKDDIVLCRYNAPLVSAFYDLLSQGKSAYVLGRDMHKGLINEVKNITKKENMPAKEFVQLARTNFNTQYLRLVNANKQNQANALEDKHKCITVFAGRADTVGGIIAEIKRVFNSNQKGDIMLSTVHKAKGLEADNVYILTPERMPHPKATNPREERNIIYVAITRAKKNLYYVGPRPKN